MHALTRLVLPAPNLAIVLAEESVVPRGVEPPLDALHPEEAALARTFASAARQAGFAAGRVALRRALTHALGGHAAREPVLRDARGRPAPRAAGVPPCSIAHSRARAIAALAPHGACAAIGVDVEEIEPSRAEALLRMAISTEERALLASVDAALLAAPLALWCARESCVKAHALEVGVFGTALVVRHIAPCAPFAEGASDHWRLELALEGRAAMQAFAWRRDGAVFGAAVSA